MSSKFPFKLSTVQRIFIKDLLTQRNTSTRPTCKWLKIKHSIDPVAHVLYVSSPLTCLRCILSQFGLIYTVTENKVTESPVDLCFV